MLNNVVYESFERPSRELVMAFADIPVANITDEMNRMGCMDAGLRPLNKRKLLGVAVTVKAAPNDNLMFHKAINIAQTGDVIVVDGKGSLTHALCGEFMYRTALSYGVEGFIVDGAVRDIDALERLDFSVYARGVQPNGPYKNGPGAVNVPVSVGGLVVEPGDIIVGDQDGIVVINPNDAPALAKRALAKFQAEQASLSQPVIPRPPYRDPNRYWVSRPFGMQNMLDASGAEVLKRRD